MSSRFVLVDRLRRLHERAKDPEDRKEDPEEEQPSVPVSDRHDAQGHGQDDPEQPAESNCPPHRFLPCC